MPRRSLRLRLRLRRAAWCLLLPAAVSCTTTSVIRTKPPGAKVYLNSRYIGDSPVQVELTDGFADEATYRARFELEGHDEYKTDLAQDWNYGALAIEGLIFAGIGLPLAYFNGKSHRGEYVFDLQANGGAYPTTPPPVAGPAPEAPRPNVVAAVAAKSLAGTRLAVLPTQFDASAKGSVPKLFDDYALAAVQQAGSFEVIGQDDINTLLGFDQQRTLIDCSETSCLADIGNALGVDRIVVVKIARLSDDWVVTAKVINIKATRVEGRVNQLIPGDVKALLQAVPAVVSDLFVNLVPAT